VVAAFNEGVNERKSKKNFKKKLPKFFKSGKNRNF
jgi:hypothetical protein